MNDLPFSRGSACIVGGGACTSVGLTMPASAAAVRAGVASFREHPFMVDTEGEPMVVARAPHLSEDVVGVDRFFHLAAPAAQEALAAMNGAAKSAVPFPLLLGFPPPRPGLSNGVAAEVAERLRVLLSARFPISAVEVVPSGHSAGLMAMEAACSILRRGSAEFCLIGGVDSYLEPETLEWLEACEQLNAAGPRNNAWGFAPGEGAGFCLIATAAAADVWRMPVLGLVDGVATAREENLIKTDTVCLGRGLTEAFEQVFQRLPALVTVDNIICDMNGEPYRGDEFGFATLRTASRFANAANFHTPADCWGDVGAASGPLFANLAMIAGRRGYAKGPRTLVWTSSESGERSAALLRQAAPEAGDSWP